MAKRASLGAIAVAVVAAGAILYASWSSEERSTVAPVPTVPDDEENAPEPPRAAPFLADFIAPRSVVVGDGGVPEAPVEIAAEDLEESVIGELFAGLRPSVQRCLENSPVSALGNIWRSPPVERRLAFELDEGGRGVPGSTRLTPELPGPIADCFDRALVDSPPVALPEGSERSRRVVVRFPSPARLEELEPPVLPGPPPPPAQ